MANWVDLASLHNPTPGTTPPASWGDGIVTNLDFLSALTAAQVLTSESTSSDSFTDLATVGPSVSVNTGTTVLVQITCIVENNTADMGGAMAFAVSGASSIAAGSDHECVALCSFAARQQSASGLILVSGLTAGTNTFTSKYRRHWGGTATFLRRRIAVWNVRT